VAENRAECEDHEFEDVGGGDSLKMALRRWREREEEEEEEEEEEGLFKADAVNEEDPERDRATQV